MPAVISMLRGVNVGGHNQIKMDALRALYESLKLRNPQTYVQSGNVVFQTEAADLAKLARKIEDAIERQFAFRPSVILRTASELRDVIARNPFEKRSGIDPGKLLVAFLAADPAPEARDKLLAIECAPDELRFSGRELYIYFPNGQGRPALKWAHVDKALKLPYTGRNWNSVTKLLEMAEGSGAFAER
ncbi:MAG: DUF1697 domain-containing protein [Bryobacteraceae bacterium]